MRVKPRSLRVKTLAIAGAAAALTLGAAQLIGGDASPRGENVTTVLQRADRLIGERTTVTGRVGEVVSATSFTVTHDAAALLVLNVSAIPAIDDNLDGVLRNEEITVSGVLRRFAPEEIESYVGPIPAERYESFVGRPVIVADSIRPR